MRTKETGICASILVRIQRICRFNEPMFQDREIGEHNCRQHHNDMPDIESL